MFRPAIILLYAHWRQRSFALLVRCMFSGSLWILWNMGMDQTPWHLETTIYSVSIVWLWVHKQTQELSWFDRTTRQKYIPATALNSNRQEFRTCGDFKSSRLFSKGWHGCTVIPRCTHFPDFSKVLYAVLSAYTCLIMYYQKLYWNCVEYFFF